MFGSSKQRQRGSAAADERDPAGPNTSAGQSRQWHAWRRSAQKVTRTWNSWLAADAGERDELYRRYVSALGEEERAAAELEHAVS